MDLTVINRDGQEIYVINSKEVAEMIDKDHSHLLRDIKGYISILNQSNFGFVDFFIESVYRDAKKELRPCYLLTRKGCDMVANKMTGEKGVLFTAAYVTKFEEMERVLQPKLPQTYAEALRELATAWEENQALLPKGQAYDSFIGKENLYTVAVVAKKLAFKGMGPNNLFAFLRERNILCSSKSKWNEPYSDYVSAGYFVLRDGAPWIDKRDVEHVEKQTFVTPKGVEFIDRMLKKSGYVQEKPKSELVQLYV